MRIATLRSSCGGNERCRQPESVSFGAGFLHRWIRRCSARGLFSGGVGEKFRPVEDRQEHWPGELAGVGVLQGRVIAGDDSKTIGQGEFGAVGEVVSAARVEDAGAFGPCEEAVERDAAQTDDYAQIRQQAYLFIEPRSAVAQLFGRG